MKPGYWTGIAALLSQILNHLILHRWGGHHDMTLSAHFYVKRTQPRWKRAYQFVNFLFFWQEDHCLSSFQADVKFAQYINIQELLNG